MKIFLISIFIIFKSYSVSFPQIVENADNDLKNFFTVGGDIFTAPEEFENKDWVNLSATGAATLTAFLLDDEVRKFSKTMHAGFPDALFSIDRYIDLPFIGIFVTGTYTYGYFNKDPKIRGLGLQLAEATIYSTAINFFIKGVSGRSRPFKDLGNMDFNPFKTTFSETSFPSGHATFSFALASVMANQSGSLYWKLSWYAFASVISAARIYHDVHWFSDVIFGAAIGYFIGEFVANHSTNKPQENLNLNKISFVIPL